MGRSRSCPQPSLGVRSPTLQCPPMTRGAGCTRPSPEPLVASAVMLGDALSFLPSLLPVGARSHVQPVVALPATQGHRGSISRRVVSTWGPDGGETL